MVTPGTGSRQVRRWVRKHNPMAHVGLWVLIALIGFPLYYAFVISTQDLREVMSHPPRLGISSHMLHNYSEAWRRADMGRLLLNTFAVAMIITVGKVAISLLSAFAMAFFEFPFKAIIFWMILLTLMLPVPIRIIATYQVVSQVGWYDSYLGLTIPLMASATGTLLFRQFFSSAPKSLADAAQLDGAGPMAFLWYILLPVSLPNIAALSVVLFIYGWNQYLWPLMMTDSDNLRTVVIGIERLIPRGGTQLPEWNITMAAAALALLPPVVVILSMQKWFVKGLLETEK